VLAVGGERLDFLRYAMLTRSYFCDKLEVRIYPDRDEAGAAGAAIAAGIVREEIAHRSKAAVVLASAVSQDPFLSALRSQDGVDWGRVSVFHLDEYAGMTADHPASFRRFQRERFIDRVPVGAFHPLAGDAPDLAAECRRYAALLREAKPCMVAQGIGENGHLAFIDPPVCDFNDPQDVRIVDLDDVCRMQQVHDGAFERIEEVPKRALSLTVPFFLRVPRVLVFVNGPNKAAAVKATLEGPVAESCPASALRRHPSAVLFLDPGAASGLA
jgi:glucosamine-6-phosphate deaminase